MALGLRARSAPLLTVSAIDATENTCLGFPPSALEWEIALISTGQCSYATKVLNAQARAQWCAVVQESLVRR